MWLQVCVGLEASLMESDIALEMVGGNYVT